MINNCTCKCKVNNGDTILINQTYILLQFHIVHSMHCELSYKFISTNKGTILYVMYFTIILLLQVLAQSPSSGS